MKPRGWQLASRLSTRSLLAFGLTSIVVCCLLVADLVGLVPDRLKAVREGRAALSEAVALSAAVLVARQDEAALSTLLGSIEARHPDLVFLQVRSLNGQFRVTAGRDPEPSRHATSPDASSDTDRIVVPVLAQEGAWGWVELRFAPDSRLAQWAPWLPQAAPLAAVLALACTLAFSLYLRRMLRHLDPSNAIPARVRTAFDTLAEGLLVLDPNGDIVLANRAFASIAGCEPDALVGRSAAMLPWQPRDEASTDEPLLPWTGALSDGQLRMGKVMVLPDSEGARRTFMVNCSPIAGARAPSGVLVSFDDVTELEEKEIELRLARDAAQAANRAKSDFLANMSHEIRTPMNAILGFTDLLRRGRGQSTTEARRFLDIIHGSGRHLLELINDILDLSKVEAGRLEIERVPTAVHQVVLEVARVMQVKADEKRLTLAVDLDGPLPAQISTDPGRLRQILTNLVGNAIKFTPAGEVRLSVKMRPGALGTLLGIDVKDSGIGIPADRVEAIFEPFVQAETSTTRKFGGTGLGLTISRKFARALGGDIVASSVPGAGSVFHVSIDCGDLSDAVWLDERALDRLREDSNSAAAEAVSWRFPSRRVLVVDDGAENRELVRVVLEEVGLSVVEAADGRAALAAVERERPDLILMDMQMPEMDGSTATRALRAAGCSLPIFALTANAMKGFEREIEAAGFSGHLTKPVDIDLLLNTLAQLLGGTRSETSAAPPVTEVAGPTPAQTRTASPSVAESNHCAAVMSEQPQSTEPVTSRLANHPRLARIARAFFDQLPSKISQMRLDLDQADFVALAAQAHWLKGAGGSVGYDAYFEPAKNLEEAAKASDASKCRRVVDDLSNLLARTVAPGTPPTRRQVQSEVVET